MVRNGIDIRSDAWYKDLYRDPKANVRTLSKELRPGEYIGIDKFGRLKIKKSHAFFHKLNIVGRKIEERRVKATITPIVSAITNYGEYTDEELEHLKALFFDRMSKLSDRVFDRSVIAKPFLTKIHPELNRAENLSKLERRVIKVQLALKLGVDLKPISAGNSGSYFARDYKGKIKAVFKPGVEDSLGATSPKLKTRLFGFFQRNVLHINTAKPFWALEGHFAEAMTSVIAEHLGFREVTPASKVVDLKSGQFFSAKQEKRKTKETGSFQQFVSGTESMDKKLKLNSQGFVGGLLLKLRMKRYRDAVTPPLDPVEFEKLAILDFLICNRDRHFENILMDDQGGMHLIDHGLSMPKQNPDDTDVLYKRNQYKWEHFPQSETKFSHGTKVLLRTMLRGVNLDHLIAQLAAVKGDNPEHPFNEISEDSSQESAFRDRVRVLLKALDKDLTMKELAQFRSKEQIEAFLIS